MEESNKPSIDQQSSQSVQQPDISPSVPHKSKLPLFILIAFVILILFGGGIYLLGAKNTNQQQPISVVPTVTKESPTPSVDSTANWKTYTSSLYKYSVKYPSEWYATDWLWDRSSGTKKYEQKQLFISPTKPAQDAYLYGGDRPVSFFEISISDIEWNDLPENSNTVTSSQITIGDEPATMKVYHEQSGFDGSFSTQIKFNHNGKGYWISWQNSDSQGNHNPKIDQILATFKFSDQNKTIDISNWKTYIDSISGISFKYPDSWKLVPRKDNRYNLELQSPDYSSKITSKEEPYLFINKGTVISILPDKPYTGSIEELIDIKTPLNNYLIENIDGRITENSIKSNFDTAYKAVEAESEIQLGTQYQIFKYIFIPFNKKLYIIQREYIKNQEPEYEDIFKQILSTSRFTNQKQEAPASSEINGFPVFPGSTFVKKEITLPCTGNESGFSTCGSTTYTWTHDKADKVYDWYTKDQSNSGWKMTGGAGGITDSQNYNGKITLKKGNLAYDLNWEAIKNNVTFTLAIPNK